MRYDKIVYETKIRRKRWDAYTKFLLKNDCKFCKYAIRNGIITQEEFKASMKNADHHFKYKRKVLAEVFSRVIGIKIICEMYGYRPSEIKHTPICCHYDLVTTDGKKFECKFRMCDNDQYDSDRIDDDKKEWNTTSTDDDVVLVYTFWDGISRAYDMYNPSDIATWSKPKGSVDKFSSGYDVETVTKDTAEYLKDNCLWTTTIMIPPDLKKAYDEQGNSGPVPL